MAGIGSIGEGGNRIPEVVNKNQRPGGKTGKEIENVITTNGDNGDKVTLSAEAEKTAKNSALKPEQVVQESGKKEALVAATGYEETGKPQAKEKKSVGIAVTA